MKGTKELKANKGITLIALVITIIVMLILVAVSISMAVNGGLFEQAGKAVSETNKALIAEGQLADGGIKVNGVMYKDIDTYVESIKSNQSPTSEKLFGTWKFNDVISVSDLMDGGYEIVFGACDKIGSKIEPINDGNTLKFHLDDLMLPLDDGEVYDTSKGGWREGYDRLISFNSKENAVLVSSEFFTWLCANATYQGEN